MDEDEVDNDQNNGRGPRASLSVSHILAHSMLPKLLEEPTVLIFTLQVREGTCIESESKG